MAEVVIHSRQVEMIPLEALKGYEKNARTHPDTQIASLVAIIRDSGFTNPLLIDDDDVIVGGHGRAIAARKLKMTEVPCVRLSGLTPEQLKSIRLSDNATGLASGWNDALLKLELSDLASAGFDLALTGFSSLELTSIFSTQEGMTDPDDVPEAPAQPVSVLGDLWRLGDHWLVCGDATTPATVEMVLRGADPMLAVTDPPYGVNYRSARRGTEFLVDGAKRAHGDVRNDTRADWREAWALYRGDVIYVWHNPLESLLIQQGLEAQAFELRAQIIWRKNSIVIGPPKGHYHWRHESAVYCVRKGKTGHWSGTRKEDTVWDVDRPKKSDTGHSTQKPIELWRRPIENHTAPGDHIYDPFAGAGVAIVAAQMTKRIAHCIEIDPSHVDRCLIRFAAFTGLSPILAETGETFDQVRERRLNADVL